MSSDTMRISFGGDLKYLPTINGRTLRELTTIDRDKLRGELLDKYFLNNRRDLLTVLGTFGEFLGYYIDTDFEDCDVCGDYNQRTFYDINGYCIRVDRLCTDTNIMVVDKDEKIEGGNELRLVNQIIDRARENCTFEIIEILLLDLHDHLEPDEDRESIEI